MEVFPNEITKIVLSQFASLNEVVKCYNVCVRWQQIIENIYKNRDKILVCGSHAIQEIIDLINVEFKYELFDKRGTRHNAVGGILQNQPIMCGGNFLYGFTKEIIVVGKPEIQPFFSINQRVRASSIVLNNTTLWITGGVDPLGGTINSSTTEFITLGRQYHPDEFPRIPFNLSAHSMIQLDSQTAYIIGGKQDGLGPLNLGFFPLNSEFNSSNKTWFVNLDNNYEFSEGPSLNKARILASCAKMKFNGKEILVVAGGYCKSLPNVGSSTEILDLSNPEKGWTMGPELPFQVYSSSMVTSPTGKGVILIGGLVKYQDHPPIVSKGLIELTQNSNGELIWIPLKQKLKYGRNKHLTLEISKDTLANIMDNNL